MPEEVNHSRAGSESPQSKTKQNSWRDAYAHAHDTHARAHDNIAHARAHNARAFGVFEAGGQTQMQGALSGT